MNYIISKKRGRWQLHDHLGTLVSAFNKKSQALAAARLRVGWACNIVVLKGARK